MARSSHTADGWHHAAFASPADARHALRNLADAGIAAADIEVRSSIPLEGVRAPGPEPRTRVPVMAVLGGVLGGIAAFSLFSLSSLAYPLPTGGMNIVPLPPSGIITFEGIAIGAILCTVATVLYEGGLLRLRREPGPLDRYLAAGSIIVSVRSTDAPPGEWASRAIVTEPQPGERP
jgi:hypothetical protein